jgi:hypothetical protein
MPRAAATPDWQAEGRGAGQRPVQRSTKQLYAGEEQPELRAKQEPSDLGILKADAFGRDWSDARVHGLSSKAGQARIDRRYRRAEALWKPRVRGYALVT